MTANLRLCYYNDHDDATLSVSGAGGSVTGFDPDNTQNTVRTSTLRSANASTNLVLSGLLPQTRTASFLMLPRHTLAGADVQLDLYSDAAWTTNVYSSGANAVTCYSASTGYVDSRGSRDPFAARAPYWLYFAETSYRSYKITFSGTPSAVSYYEVARIYLGRYLELSINPQYASDILNWIDQSTRGRTQGGTLRGDLGALIRTWKFTLNDLTEDETMFLSDGFQNNGTVGEWAISMFPGDGTRIEALYTGAGTLSGLNAIGRQVSRLTSTLQFEED